MLAYSNVRCMFRDLDQIVYGEMMTDILDGFADDIVASGKSNGLSPVLQVQLGE